MRELKTYRLEPRADCRGVGRRGKLAWDEGGGKQRERSRATEGTVKLKILGIWVVLFVWICDCFVVDFWFV